MKTKRMKITEVEETPYGVYVWQMPSGALVADENGNYLCVNAIKGDIKRIANLRKVAASYGLEEGHPMWMGGHRKIDDEEYAMQKSRLELGLVPDEWDLPALKEDIEEKRKLGLYK
jgi:hypothetical protein